MDNINESTDEALMVVAFMMFLGLCLLMNGLIVMLWFKDELNTLPIHWTTVSLYIFTHLMLVVTILNSTKKTKEE